MLRRRSQIGVSGTTGRSECLRDGLTRLGLGPPPGIRAENLADTYKICGQEQDQLALSTDIRAETTMGDAKFQDETVPVNVAHGVGDRKIVTRDEGPKPNTTDEKRAMLPTLFDKDGAATAGNCSSMDDCHSVLLIVQERKAEELGLTPLAPIMSYPVVGTDPNNMRISLYELLVGTLKHANLTLQDNCPIKLNEAFATEYLAVERELGLDRSLKSTLFGPVSVT